MRIGTATFFTFCLLAMAPHASAQAADWRVYGFAATRARSNRSARSARACASRSNYRACGGRVTGQKTARHLTSFVWEMPQWPHAD